MIAAFADRAESARVKVSSSPSLASALEAWLQEPAAADPVAQAGRQAERNIAAPETAGGLGRDPAAGLLTLDVWGGLAAGSRALSSTAPAPRPAPLAAAAAWVEHIFEPLV